MQNNGNVGEELQFSFVVDSAQAEVRLDVAVTDYLRRISEEVGEEEPLFRPTRSRVAVWISEGRVTVQGSPARKAGHRLSIGEHVSLRVPLPEGTEIVPDSSIPLNIVFEDKELLVIDKQAHLTVHPGAGVKGGTLVNAVLAHLGGTLPGVGSPARPGIVHRLDKGTSGLLLVAKTGRAYESFVQQFLNRSVSRRYVALVGKLPQGGPTIALPIGRDQRDRTRMAAVKQGKEAVTEWSMREALGYGFLLELQLRTGRTHQIRVHLQARGAPILGDLKYGPPAAEVPGPLRPKVAALGRQALHAEQLTFLHPTDGTRMTFSAALPDDLAELVAACRAYKEHR